MSIRLMVEMLDHAPAELTPSERLLLVAIAEKANEQTRISWPGMDTLTRRTGLGDRQVRRMLADLAARGYEVRVQCGVDRHGKPVFATKGHQTVYRVPTFRQRGTHTPALKEDTYDRLSDPKADISGTQRRTSSPSKGDAHVPPSPQKEEPSKNNPSDRGSDGSRNGTPTKTAGNRRSTPDLDRIRAALAGVGSKRTDDDWCHKVVKQVLDRTTVKHDLTATVITSIHNTPDDFKPVPQPPSVAEVLR